VTLTTSGLTVASVAALGLAGTEFPATAQPLDDTDWATLRREVRQHRLTGLLLAGVDAGLAPATAAQRDDLVADQVQAMSGALLLEDLLLEVVDLFEQRGIEVRALKGTAVAHLDYPQPEMRSYGDVDVLVRPQQIDHAVQVLVEHGLERLYPAPAAGWDRRWAKGITFRTCDGTELDLHRTFATPPLGLRLDTDDLWSSAQGFAVADRHVLALSRELRLLNAAFSAAVGDTVASWPTLRDIAQLATHPDLDVGRVRDLAHRSGATAVLASAVTTAWAGLRIADVTALSAWAERYQPTERERRELALYQEHRASETARALASLRVLPSMLERVRFLWALGRPHSGLSAVSGRRPVQRLRNAAAELRAARRR
jgi:hypothetical protein